MRPDAHVEDRFLEVLSKERRAMHDLRYCYACGRSILPEEHGVEISKEREMDILVWRFCQIDHVPEGW